MTMSGLFRAMCVGIVSLSVGACGGGENQAETPAAAPGSPLAMATASGDPCPFSPEQIAGVTGTPMTLTGACTFFPANGRDIPHVFYVLQVPMVCTTIKPSDIGFTETVTGLSAREAYVRDQIDGSHVLVCPNGNSRAFDIVVDLKNDKATNREVAIGLAKQVLAGR